MTPEKLVFCAQGESMKQPAPIKAVKAWAIAYNGEIELEGCCYAVYFEEGEAIESAGRAFDVVPVQIVPIIEEEK